MSPSNAARLAGRTPASFYMAAQRGSVGLVSVPVPKLMVPVDALVKMLVDDGKAELAEKLRKLMNTNHKDNLDSQARQILGEDYATYKGMK